MDLPLAGTDPVDVKEIPLVLLSTWYSATSISSLTSHFRSTLFVTGFLSATNPMKFTGKGTLEGPIDRLSNTAKVGSLIKYDISTRKFVFGEFTISGSIRRIQ